MGLISENTWSNEHTQKSEIAYSGQWPTRLSQKWAMRDYTSMILLAPSTFRWQSIETDSAIASSDRSTLPADQSRHTPMEWPLIALQGFSGMIVATVSSILLRYVLEFAIIGSNITNENIRIASLSAGIISLAVTPWIVSGTVYGVGRLSHNYEGHFWWALLGAYAGEALAFGLAQLMRELDTSPNKDISRILTFIFEGLLTSVGTVIFYVLFRRANADIIHIGSLLNLECGRWRWGIPLPQIARWENQTTTSIALISGRF
jgi:hypothetical protein